MTVGTTGWGRAEAGDRQWHGTAMLAATATTCGNWLLPLQEGHSKSCKLQEKHQTGKRPAHEHEDCTTSQSCAWAERDHQRYPGHDRPRRRSRGRSPLQIAVSLKLSMGDRSTRHYNGRFIWDLREADATQSTGEIVCVM